MAQGATSQVCDHCEVDILPGDRFCWSCGASLSPRRMPAGLGRRGAAWLIDATVCAAPAYAAFSLIAITQAQPPQILRPQAQAVVPGYVVASLFGAWVLVGCCYFVLLRRQTLGYYALGLRLQDARTGGDVGPMRSLARFLLRVVLYVFFLLPGILNDLFTLWTRRRQNLIDLICRTAVVMA